MSGSRTAAGRPFAPPEPPAPRLGVARSPQAAANAALWAREDLVEHYVSRQLRAVEVDLLVRYRDTLTGRVLELGTGAGRVTGYLDELARELHGLDVNRAMAAECARRHPAMSMRLGDLRHLSGYESRAYDAIVATNNLIDVLDDAERGTLLDELGRLLAPGGTLIFSSHNRAFAPRIRGPIREALSSPGRAVRGLPRLGHSLRNRRRMRTVERVERGYAILNDVSHEFLALHYYVSRDDQERQLAEHGLELMECLDLEGVAVARGEHAAECPELHYVARRAL
jgi:SAM-dependent methyltransferase